MRLTNLDFQAKVNPFLKQHTALRLFALSAEDKGQLSEELKSFFENMHYFEAPAPHFLDRASFNPKEAGVVPAILIKASNADEMKKIMMEADVSELLPDGTSNVNRITLSKDSHAVDLTDPSIARGKVGKDIFQKFLSVPRGIHALIQDCAGIASRLNGGVNDIFKPSMIQSLSAERFTEFLKSPWFSFTLRNNTFPRAEDWSYALEQFLSSNTVDPIQSLVRLEPQQCESHPLGVLGGSSAAVASIHSVISLIKERPDTGGRQVIEQRCNLCHSPSGMASKIPLLNEEGMVLPNMIEKIKSSIHSGKMGPNRKLPRLTDDERRQILLLLEVNNPPEADEDGDIFYNALE